MVEGDFQPECTFDARGLVWIVELKILWTSFWVKIKWIAPIFQSGNSSDYIKKVCLDATLPHISLYFSQKVVLLPREILWIDPLFFSSEGLSYFLDRNPWDFSQKL